MGLRRAAIEVELRRHFWGSLKEVRLWTSRGQYHRVGPTTWRTVESSGLPVAVGEDRGRTLWVTDDGYYWDDEGHSAEDVGLLVWDRRRRQDHRLGRLRRLREAAAQVETARRERIPAEIQAFVWERDDGRCVRCEATEDLQFDHVIPVAKGGGTSAENLQVLCGSCNRTKSDSVG